MIIVKSVKVPLVILAALAVIFIFSINISALSMAQVSLDKGDMLIYKERLIDQGLVHDFEVEHKPIKGYIKFYEIYDKYCNAKLKVGERLTYHKETLLTKETGLRYGFPLKAGLKWDEDSERNDNMYCWYVETIEDVTVSAGTFRDCFKIVYDTCPDTTTEWYYPGVGIIKYEYDHHGTITNETRELMKIVRK